MPIIELNYSDNFLSNAVDVTAQLQSIPPPASSDLAFLPSVSRMAYVSSAYPSSILFSNQDDPANLSMPDAELQVEPTDGGRMVCVRELRNGQIIAVKTTGGYQINPTSDPPSLWGKNRLWDHHGPPNVRCVAVGPDFLVFGCKAGLYRYYGPALDDPLTYELRKTWQRVNWQAQQPMWLVVDDDEKVLHVGIALDDADYPTQELTCDYWMGWEKAVMLTMMGTLIPNRYGRRWSVNTGVAAHCAELIDRTLETPLDTRINTRQFVYGRAGSTTAALDLIRPDVYDDNGAPIDDRYVPAYTQGENMILRFGGISGQAIGSGDLHFQPVTDDPNVVLPEQTYPLPADGTNIHFARGLLFDNQHLTYSFSSGTAPGSFFMIQEGIIYFRPLFPASIF